MLNKDVTCLSETHLSKKDTVNVDGYSWLGFNRSTKHVQSPFTHGGVGISKKNNMYDQYTINVIDKSFDGILGIKLTHKITKYNIVIFSCYLPPDNSPWAEPYLFFEHLLYQLYLHKQEDALCDFNARLGNKIDISNFDKIPKRKPIDFNKNAYCYTLLEFLKDGKCCIVNGRFEAHKDNFTSTGKGNAVVDYIIVPHYCLKYCSNFEVILMADLMCKNNLYEHDNLSSKPPDHCVICVNIFSGCKGNIDNNQNPIVGQIENNAQKKYNFENIPECFMDNENWRQNIEILINKMEQTQIGQKRLTICTINFVGVFLLRWINI